ncbi:ethanolamine utilization protein EutH [Desulfovibrio sp. OttesenSCG-928-G15]|nr:ethanolamine utilization protein EutH [Desulfovibrio sp. OttesenSCG-928-G15]
MALVGTFIVYIIMACLVIGALASIFRPGSALGNQFQDGIHSIGPIFLCVAGIFASIPFLTSFIELFIGPLFSWLGADPSIAPTTIIAVDMGGYQLAEALAKTKENWIMAMYTGYMAGATIVFIIPVGLKFIRKQDESYFALGIMAGLLSIPFGVLVACVITALGDPVIRSSITTVDGAMYQLNMNMAEVFLNLIPLASVCIVIALGLRFKPGMMIRGFIYFGRFLEISTKLILVASILEIFTGVFSTLFGSWGFDPVIADEKNLERALEIVGYVCMMLAGAFPMVYLIQTYCAKPLGKIGRVVGLSPSATAALLAASANVIAMFPMLADMRARDKVLAISYSVCGAFLIGDHLSFMANFQPTLILPLFLGKIFGGTIGLIIAQRIAVPEALKIESAESLTENESTAA